MARGRYSNDADQNFQIESGIAQTLRGAEAAEIDTATIEKGYTHLEFDDHGEEMPGTIEEKCSQIVTVLHDNFEVDTEYEICGETTKFRPVKPR